MMDRKEAIKRLGLVPILGFADLDEMPVAVPRGRQRVAEYDTSLDGYLPGHRITVNGVHVPHVFRFGVEHQFARAYSIANPCPGCGDTTGEKHVRRWGNGSHVQWLPATNDQWFPEYPDPVGCWFEVVGEVRLVDPDGYDATDEFLYHRAAYIRKAMAAAANPNPRTAA